MNEPARPSQLTRAQRTILGILGGAVAIALIVLVAALAFRGDPGSDEAAPVTSSSTTPSTVPTTSTTEASGSQTTAPSATSTSTTTTEPTTTTTVDPATLLTLLPDGVGDIRFGTDAQQAVNAFEAILGPPTEDSGWVGSFSVFGTCPGTEVRVVRWVGLEVFLTDGPTEWGPAGTRHFFSWANSSFFDVEPMDLRTREGIGIGSTVADVRATFGDGSVALDEPIFGPSFAVDSGGAGYLWGTFSGPADTDTVHYVQGGFGCGE